MSEAYPQEAPPKRYGLKTALLAGFVLLIFFLSRSDTSVSALSADVKDAAQHIRRPTLPKITVPNIRNPFRQAAHKPPVQRNSTSGEAKWHNDWHWLSPFSDSITLEEDRSVLPPARTRPPIYTFYDTSLKKSDGARAAEKQLLLIWRRAWWAKGFKPVILGRAEAMNNPLYETMQGKEVKPALEKEIMRWLAWGHMGTGILANWLVLPMGPYEDDLLSYLRRRGGEFPKLTRYESLASGLFSSDKNSINEALNQILKSDKLEKSKTILEVLDPHIFTVDPKPLAIAFYDTATLTSTYQAVAISLRDDDTAGLNSLAQLITSHLHLTFTNSFSSGIAIVNSHGPYTAILLQSAFSIANALIACPVDPVPASCPPNNPKCTPCSSSKPLQITTPKTIVNDTNLFTLSTFPHPYTLASLLFKSTDLTTRHIRRETARDPYLFVITQEMLGKDVAGPSRIVTFKESVASEHSMVRSIWITEETILDKRDLEWHFGFGIASNDIGKETDVVLRGPTGQGVEKPSDLDMKEQKTLMTQSKEILAKGKKGRPGVKEVVEAWNLADTEAWRFVRAFGAREKMERLKWEEEEKAFAGGDEVRGERWGKWFDRK